MTERDGTGVDQERPLPDGHEWYDKPRMDRLVFWCDDCDMQVAVTASDTQAGIQLYCPDCNAEMDGDWPDG